MQATVRSWALILKEKESHWYILSRRANEGCVLSTKLVSVLQTDKQNKERSPGRLIVQARDDGGLNQSESSEGAKN